MGQILHGWPTRLRQVATQYKIVRSASKLCLPYGINSKTVVKRRKRTTVKDAPMEPKEADFYGFDQSRRKSWRILWDNCLYALQASILRLPRSSVYRCLQRHGIRRLPYCEGNRQQDEKVQILSCWLLPYIGIIHLRVRLKKKSKGYALYGMVYWSGYR